MNVLGDQKQYSNAGVHYFPDTLHYRVEDLNKWLPELKRLRVSSIVLKSPCDRAIPEFFLKSLLQENINPIIEFNLPLNKKVNTQELRVIAQAYAHWGVKYVVLFDRPNEKSNWKSASWVQNDLVDRFLDQFIPLARLVIEEKLTCVFPPLEPGGSYWDTAFLRGCFNNLQRRMQTEIIQNMVLSAYAHHNDKDIDWGLGGPQQWPETRPYITPQNSQDQRGFRIYEWYQAIAQAVFQKEFPIILFQAGLNHSPHLMDASPETQKLNWKFQSEIIHLIQYSYDPSEERDQGIEEIPTNVISVNFWLLAEEMDKTKNSLAWYRNGEPVSPCIQLLQANGKEEVLSKSFSSSTKAATDSRHPIRHYVLLPVFESGVSEWHLAVAQPFVIRHQATLGFSLNEARFAAQVTVVANPKTISEECLNDLRKSGSIVERISGDGTSIATKLAER